MADSLFESMTRTLGARASRRTVITASATGAFGALGLRAGAQGGPATATPAGSSITADSLPSWTAGPARDAILAFLASVTDPASSGWVDPGDRIAAFDLDGTLWCEAPTVPQGLFMLQYVHQQAEAHPELRTVQPYKAVWEQDTTFFSAAAKADAEGDVDALNAFFEVIMGPLAGITPAEYETIVQGFFDRALHPEFQVPIRRITYQPMIELLATLQANAFDVYIVTGGGRDFVRVISEGFFAIPRANVIGSSVDLTYEATDEGVTLVRQATMDQPFDNGPGKPVRIEMQVGRQPILVGGNSDGDVAMLAYANEQHANFLGLLVHHDDEDREYAYDQGAETALELAGVHGWTVVSMKEDFATVFPSGDA